MRLGGHAASFDFIFKQNRILPEPRDSKYVGNEKVKRVTAAQAICCSSLGRQLIWKVEYESQPLNALKAEWPVLVVLPTSFTPFKSGKCEERGDSESARFNQELWYLHVHQYLYSFSISCEGYSRNRWIYKQVYLTDASSFQMYVDAVVLNKIKIYFKTSQIHYVFCFYTFLIIKSSLLLFEGPYAEKSWQSVFYSRM